MQTNPIFGRLRAGQKKSLMTIMLALAASAAYAEDEASWTPPGFPSGVDWTFNFDASVGAFGFGNSLYTNPRPGEPSGDLTANWTEGVAKPTIGGEYTMDSSAQIYGKFSVVGERTYGSAPDLVGGDAGSFKEEDAYLGWRSGNTIGGGENVLDLTLGRAQYQLGHGMLLYDGSSEGGSNGGYWTNARKAFEFAAIGRFKPGNNTFEAFYLDKDELPESDSNTEIAGFNYEYAIGEDTTLGATYMTLSADPDDAPDRDGMDVYNFRAFTAPFASLKALSFEAEYAKEDNGDILDSSAWNALVAYQFDSSWEPKLSYRYAYFEGDDPETAINEGFDSMLTGAYDWGSWWQGEIGGGFFLSNSNLISHQIRIHTSPSESISTGLIYYNFLTDVPVAVGPNSTSDKVANEIDWYTDWSINDNFTLSVVLAVADPNEIVEKTADRDDLMTFGIVYLAYSF
ncbi:MAG TPA: hypothetical protein VLC79_00465 [Cellvibrio sp.]|nr:hypothetical protein [Cellvibrio sp.]